jgi:hypothetical protein
MPRKLRAAKAKEQLTDAQWDYLRDDYDAKDRTDQDRWWELFALRYDSQGVRSQLWNLHRDVILAEHVKESPGTRPELWWKYDAPRQPTGTFPGAWYDGNLPQPRERLGGIGTPAYECRSVAPTFAYGIPDIWVDMDEDDPPTFESQAAYLKRHGLLLAGEQRRADFEQEAVPSGWNWPF